jgi:rRNA small subunit pseudouridine methyltransferase Nep1
MLHVLLLDCALELIPSEMTGLKEIQQSAARRKKKPGALLLDQAYHGRSMTRLKDSERRGRPDIVYLCLMTLLETPLCKAGLLTVHLHLSDGTVIQVSPEVRLPRNYDRFTGLMEQLLERGRVPLEGEPLMRVTGRSLKDLVDALKGGGVQQCILAVEHGRQTSTTHLGELLPKDSSVSVVVGIGAFPHGNLSDETQSLFETHVELDPETMMAWHVCGEIVWAYSCVVDVTGGRYRAGITGQ